MEILNNIENDSSFVKKFITDAQWGPIGLVEYKKPWCLEQVKTENSELKNPIIINSSTTTISFKVEKIYDNSEKIGFIGMPGKNFGISYDFDINKFVFEYWTKSKSGSDNFYCHKDFDITRDDIERGITITIQYDKENKTFKLYNNFKLFFEVTFNEDLIDEYSYEALYFGAHNIYTEQLKHKCFTEIELNHFSIFNGIVDIEIIQNFFNKKNNNCDNLICYFDFKEKYLDLVYDKNTLYNLNFLDEENAKFSSKKDVKTSPKRLVDEEFYKFEKSSSLLVKYKQPWWIWPFQSYGMIKNEALTTMNSGDFTISVSFKPGKMMEESQIGAICARPGEHTGFTLIAQSEIRFELWYEKNGEHHWTYLKRQIANTKFFNQFNLLTVTYNKEKKEFKFYINGRLEDTLVIDGEYLDYSGLPIYLGCAAHDRDSNTYFMECEYDFFILCNSIVNINDIILLKENFEQYIGKNNYIKTTFSKNIVVCYNFEEKTPYKVWDFSGNSNYMIKVKELE